MKIDETLVQKLIDFLKEIGEEFQKNKGLILTEDDLKCLLFSKIYKFLPTASTIDQEISASAIHSEVKFYDEEGQLTLIPDLCIVQPNHISIYHSVEFKIQRSGYNQEYKNLPRKCFEIGGDTIIIELKYCRDRNGIASSDIDAYKNDISKIKRLQEIVARRSLGRDKMFGIFAIFNKTNNGKDLLTPSLTSEDGKNNIRIFYGTGMVDFNSEHQCPGNSGYLSERHAWC